MAKRSKTPDERQAAKLNRYSESLDTGWQKFKLCYFCGRSFCVNNYPDRKPRTPKFQKQPICPWCDCRSSTGKVKNIPKYKTLMSRIVADIVVTDRKTCLIDEGVGGDCTCMLCKLGRVLAIEEKDAVA